MKKNNDQNISIGSLVKMLKINTLAGASSLVLAAAFATAAQANDGHHKHGGFYVGAKIGPSFNTGQFTDTANDAVPVGQGLASKGGAGAAFFGGLNAGYAWTFGKVYMAFDLSLLMHNLNKTVFSQTVGNTGLRVGTLGTQSAKLKNTFFYQAAMRFGYELCNHVVPFVSLGVSGGKYKLTLKNGTDFPDGGLLPDTEKTLSKQVIGFTPGLGVLVPVTQKLLMTMEYNALLGPKVSGTLKATGAGDESYSQKITQHTLSIGFAYKF
jgi:opacity protein-like surface antigen